MKGRIVKGIAGFYYVHTGSALYECRAKGVFRNKGLKPLVGDIAEIEVLDEDNKKGNVVGVETRKNHLIRPSVANIDQALVVFAGAKPAPNLNLLDKFLVMMEIKKIPAVIIFTKSDISDEKKLKEFREIYSKVYKVIEISVKDGRGTDELKGLLKNKTTVFAGPSGVGKSSLTNFLVPEAKMETGEISKKIERGKQTTRHAELFYAGDGAYICDTPGFGSMEISALDKKELKFMFPEFTNFEKECRFNGCVHIGERECGVKSAMESREIAGSRYENYRMIYEEIANKKEF